MSNRQLIPALSHGEEFDAALDECVRRFETVDRLEEMVRYPTYVTEWYGDQLPPLFELEPYMRSPWDNVPTTRRMPPPMVNVAWALFGYTGRDDDLLGVFQRLIEANPVAFVRADESPEVHDEIKTLLAERRKLLDYAAVLNFQTTLDHLEWDARSLDGEKSDEQQTKKKQPRRAAESVWRPLRGSNPCCRRERAVSLPLDEGDAIRGGKLPRETLSVKPRSTIRHQRGVSSPRPPLPAESPKSGTRPRNSPGRASRSGCECCPWTVRIPAAAPGISGTTGRSPRWESTRPRG